MTHDCKTVQGCITDYSLNKLITNYIWNIYCIHFSSNDCHHCQFYWVCKWSKEITNFSIVYNSHHIYIGKRFFFKTLRLNKHANYMLFHLCINSIHIFHQITLPSVLILACILQKFKSSCLSSYWETHWLYGLTTPRVLRHQSPTWSSLSSLY